MLRSLLLLVTLASAACVARPAARVVARSAAPVCCEQPTPPIGLRCLDRSEVLSKLNAVPGAFTRRHRPPLSLFLAPTIVPQLS